MSVSREDLSKLRQKFANDFNLLQDKFDNMMKVTKICHEASKALKQRVTDLEEKVISLEKDCSDDCDNTSIDDEISELKDKKVENIKEIREIEERLAHLETEQKNLKETVKDNKNSADKFESEIHEMSQQLSTLKSVSDDRTTEKSNQFCKVCNKRFKEK